MIRLIALFTLAVVACAGPPPPSATPVVRPPLTAHSTDAAGAFVLDFELPRTQWAEREAITGEARLTLTRGDKVVVSGSGTPLAFAFREVNGDRAIEPAWTADCARHLLDSAEPMRAEIRKSGGWDPDDADAAFYRQFFSGPSVRLPAGEWDITAIALFSEGDSCGGRSHELRATGRVDIR